MSCGTDVLHLRFSSAFTPYGTDAPQLQPYGVDVCWMRLAQDDVDPAAGEGVVFLDCGGVLKLG